MLAVVIYTRVSFTHPAAINISPLPRYSIGLGGLAALALTLPAAAHSPGALLGVTAAVGVAYSIAFGTSYQLAARFPPNCTVALTTGEGVPPSMYNPATICRRVVRPIVSHRARSATEQGDCTCWHPSWPVFVHTHTRHGTHPWMHVPRPGAGTLPRDPSSINPCRSLTQARLHLPCRFCQLWRGGAAGGPSHQAGALLHPPAAGAAEPGGSTAVPGGPGSCWAAAAPALEEAGGSWQEGAGGAPAHLKAQQGRGE
jgi:hypothetical protein